MFLYDSHGKERLRRVKTSLPSLTPSPQTDADHSRPRAARRVQSLQLNTHQLRLEQLFIRCFRVRSKLTLTFVRNFRITLIGESSRTFQRHDAHRFLFRIQERRGHLSVIDVFQTSLSQSHSRDALIASVMQRSISTHTINFLRSTPRGSSTPIKRQPSSAMRAPRS